MGANRGKRPRHGLVGAQPHEVGAHVASDVLGQDIFGKRHRNDLIGKLADEKRWRRRLRDPRTINSREWHQPRASGASERERIFALYPTSAPLSRGVRARLTSLLGHVNRVVG